MWHNYSQCAETKLNILIRTGGYEDGGTSGLFTFCDFLICGPEHSLFQNHDNFKISQLLTPTL